MVGLRESNSQLASNGLYVVARPDGFVRALVDPAIAGATPGLPNALKSIGEILRGCTPDQPIALWVKLERGPGNGGTRQLR